MRSRAARPSGGSWVERHRRPLIAGYLAALGIVCATVLVPPLRSAMADTVERVLELRTEAWEGRIAEAEALVAASRFAEAEPVLVALDRDFPARTRLHALDRERERILHALGRTYLALDRKGSTLDTYRRAVAFDPLNVANRFALATAAIHFAEPAEARAQLDSILDIYPPHPAATRELIALRADDSDYEGVMAAFRRYAGAFRVHAFLALAGETRHIVRVPVDGRTYVVEVPFPPGAPDVELRPTYPTVEIAAVHWVGRARAGEPGTRSGPATPLEPGPDGAVRFGLGPDAAAARITLSAGIPVDSATWERVATAYRNLLLSDTLDALAPRIAVVPAAEWESARTEAP